MPEGPSFVAGQPSPRVQGRRLIWDLGKMEAGATRSLRVILQPSGTPDLSPDSVAVFEVRHYSRVTVNLREPAKPTPADEPYLLMRIGGATYGMPASQVAEIRTLISGETVPTHVDWNGTRFLVVDPRVPLGWPTDAATTRRRLVLACASGRHAAMIVDRTIGLRFLGSGASIACSSRSLRPHVSGFASLAGRLVSLLDLESVLAALQDTV
jgi:chemotaxis signal transduction protein